MGSGGLVLPIGLAMLSSPGFGARSEAAGVGGGVGGAGEEGKGPWQRSWQERDSWEIWSPSPQ